jgi:hypothetical protein
MNYIKKISEEDYGNSYKTSYANALNKNLVKVESLLEKYEEAGELIAKEHKEINESIGRIIETIYSGEIGVQSFITHNQDYEKTEIENYLFFDYPTTVTGLKKYNKNLIKMNPENESEKVKVAFELANKMTEELLALRERSIALKPMIVKKRAAVVKKEVEEAERGSHKDVMKAKEHLDNVIEEYREDIVKNNKKSVLHRYKQIINALEEDGLKKSPSTRNPRDKEVFAQDEFVHSEKLKVADYGERSDTHFKLKDDSILDKQAQEEAERIYSDLKLFYVSRISEKVAVILSDKNNLANITTTNLNVKNEIEANLQFDFEDGSKFDLSTRVEWVSSYSGDVNDFIRIPTRFHNVVTPDGVLHTAGLSQKVAQDLYKKDYGQKEIESYLTSKKSEVEVSISPKKPKI